MSTETIIFDTSPQTSGIPLPGAFPLEFLRKILPSSLTSVHSEKKTVNHSSLSPENLQQKEKVFAEIPNPEKDKLVVILNFILREVLPLPNRQQQKDLLVYFFRSILSETQRLPITHLAYEISPPSPEKPLALHDDMYKVRPDLLQICSEVLEADSITDKERARYGLEKKQIEALLRELTTLLTLSPHGTLEFLATDQSLVAETKKPSLEDRENSATIQTLTQQGWKTLTAADAFSFIQPNVKEKLQIENHFEEILVGPKYFYVMPQSEVHVGNLSIMVLAQPLFIPSLNRYVLLHDQHMAPKDWTDHAELFSSLGVQIPPNFSSLSFSEKEKFVMNTLISLPEKLQEKTSLETILELFPEKKFWTKLRQKRTQKKIKKMESSLEEYADLLLDVTEQETHRDPELKPPTVKKLSNFLKRVVLSGILDTKRISSQKRLDLFHHFQEHGNLPESAFALSVSKLVGFSSATKAFDTSLLECVALSPFTSVQQLAQLQISGPFNAENLSRSGLSKYVGGERAKDWTIGNCSRCPNTNTWIGECSWCLNCEMGYKMTKPRISSSPPKAFTEKALSPQKTFETKTEPETLNSFIALLM